MGDGHLRLSDTERDQAAAVLGEHFAQGRLSADEHADRLDQVWAARTRADLDPVFRDLPSPDRDASGRRRTSHRPTYWSGGLACRGGFPPPFFAVLAVLILLTVVTHVPFVLLGALAVLFVVLRHRGGRRWARPVR